MVTLPRAIADEIVAHARAGLPNEACGLLGGRDGTVTRFIPTRSAEPSPFWYRIDPTDQLHAFLAIEDADEEVVAVYHSHVQSPAFPSRTDVERASWPDVAYLIVSLASEPPDLKAFTLRDGKVARRELVIA